MQNHALYQITTKALIFDGEKVLVLRTSDGSIDFPGGRIDESERTISWQEALQREIAEELGADFKTEIGQTLFVSKRQYGRNDVTHYVAAIFFACKYMGGAVMLSEEHSTYTWLLPADIFANNEKFISEDEEAQLRAYFS